MYKMCWLFRGWPLKSCLTVIKWHLKWGFDSSFSGLWSQVWHHCMVFEVRFDIIEWSLKSGLTSLNGLWSQVWHHWMVFEVGFDIIEWSLKPGFCLFIECSLNPGLASLSGLWSRVRLFYEVMCLSPLHKLDGTICYQGYIWS